MLKYLQHLPQLPGTLTLFQFALRVHHTTFILDFYFTPFRFAVGLPQYGCMSSAEVTGLKLHLDIWEA